jgi:hypothetical protein
VVFHRVKHIYPAAQRLHRPKRFYRPKDIYPAAQRLYRAKHIYPAA